MNYRAKNTVHDMRMLLTRQIKADAEQSGLMADSMGLGDAMDDSQEPSQFLDTVIIDDYVMFNYVTLVSDCSVIR